jgi:anti-sigma regulatory factor (Ser/Thr protein kinase)
MQQHRADVSCDLLGRPSAVSDARVWLADVLSLHVDTSATRAVLEDAVLCVSELVTNAVSAGSTAMTLCVELSAATLRLSLRDDAPGSPRVRDPDWTDPRGRGLRIVAAVSDAWGVEPRETGKEVWATLRWPERGSADGSPTAH